jgi:hypothetical protein
MSITTGLLARVLPTNGQVQITNAVSASVFTGTGTTTLVDVGAEKAWRFPSGVTLSSGINPKTIEPNQTGSGITVAVRFRMTQDGSGTIRLFDVVGNTHRIGIRRSPGPDVYTGDGSGGIFGVSVSPLALNATHTIVFVASVSSVSAADIGKLWRNRTGRPNNNPDAVGGGFNLVPSIVLDRVELNSNPSTAYDLLDFVVWGRELTDAECAAVADDIRGAFNTTPTPIAFNGSVPNQTATKTVPFTLDLSTYFTGNQTPFTYEIASGTLPPGLSLNGSSITGTPT